MKLSNSGIVLHLLCCAAGALPQSPIESPARTPSHSPSMSPATTAQPTTDFFCDACEFNRMDLDSRVLIDKVDEAAKKFMVDFDLAIGGIDCTILIPADAETQARCERDKLSQLENLANFDIEYSAILDSAKSNACLQAGIEPQDILCPAENGKPQIDDFSKRMLQNLPPIVNTCVPPDEAQIGCVRTTTSKRDQNNVFNQIAAIGGLQIASDAARGALDLIPECGGCILGDACSVAATATKFTLAALAASADIALASVQINLDILDDADGDLHFEFSQANFDNILVAHVKLDSVIEKVDDANEKLDDILCPFELDGLNTAFLRQGCDGIDQDCNEEVDECKEDQTPPCIDLKTSIPTTPFGSVADAEAFLNENLDVSDDCVSKLQLKVEIERDADPNCEKCMFVVTATDERCAPEMTPASSTQETFVIEVDSTPAEITCGFFTPQDRFHVALGAFDPFSAAVPDFPPVDDPLHVDSDAHIFDVALWFQVETDEAVNVDVRVLSNELDDNRMARIVKRQDLPGVVARAMVYLAPLSCRDSDFDPICEIEDKAGITTRIYDIEISSTDAAGNTGSKVCSVIVVPEGHYDSKKGKGKGGGRRRLSRKTKMGQRRRRLMDMGVGDDDDGEEPHNFDDLRDELALSTQRFEVASLTLLWDPELDTDLVTPPLPEPEEESSSSEETKTTKTTTEATEGNA